MLPRNKTEPGGKVTAAPELLHCRRKGRDCHCADWPDTRNLPEPPNNIALFGFCSDMTINLINFFVQLGNLA